MTEETSLCDMSALSLRRLLLAKEVSPVELLTACHQRIDAVNPAVNAIVAEDRAAALAAAKQAEAAILRGETQAPLLGLPIGIKDLNETAGLRTTFGSPAFAEHVPAKDDAFVATVRAAGGIIAAKTNTPEFGAGANTTNAVYGTTANPYDTALTCGGSSGGSAVALATGMLPLAGGSDLGGSLRTPAAYCGIVGYRATPGLVPTARKAMGWSPLWTEGPMARSLGDLLLFLSAIAGEDRRDPLSGFTEGAAFGGLRPASLEGVKVAVSEDLGAAPVSQAVRRLFRQRCAALGEIVDCREANPALGEQDRCFEVLRAVGFLGELKSLVERSPALVGPNVTANVKLGLTFSAVDVAEALVAQTALYHRFLAFMEDYDLLVCPVASVQPFDKAQLFPTEIDGQPLATYISWVAITYVLTLTGHPVLVLPCGLDENGLPFGLQFVGRKGRDRELLRLGLALEEALAKETLLSRSLPDIAGLHR
ncbi:amidase [Pelagibius litoralis]|uniref:Amidase n=1 Tax=Pelagibius litoralis TaxID=374515 RepID=A0A967EW14_9PROT|nr:amidase family protein [Pelagibius litoralis]NIA68974.1 amidase [Pelagibius litoralis]